MRTALRNAAIYREKAGNARPSIVPKAAEFPPQNVPEVRVPSGSPEDRKMVWEAELSTRGGSILLELSDSVAEQIIQSTEHAVLRQRT